jgi:hypothetical protein
MKKMSYKDGLTFADHQKRVSPGGIYLEGYLKLSGDASGLYLLELATFFSIF